jgi:site-specific DNA-adenine methylase
MPETPTISGTLPYYGAKRDGRLLDPILRAIGSPDIFLDLTCGSGSVPLAVALGKSPPRTIVVNDLNRDVYNLAKILQREDSARDLYRFAETSLFAEALVAEYVEVLAQPFTPIDVERAKAYLYVSWTALNGFAGTDAKPRFNVRYTATGGDPAKRWRSVAESIPVWHEAMRRWSIVNRDLFAILKRLKDREGLSVYLDPPYHPESRSPVSYLHDFPVASAGELFESEDERSKVDAHFRMERELRRFTKARIVVSQYDCPSIREIYPESRWVWDLNPVTKSIANASNGSASAVEVVLSKRR